MNEAFLSDAAVKSEVLQAIDQYFELNALPETPISVVWTTHKAVLRGKLIGIASAQNKMNRQWILDLTTELDILYKNTSRQSHDSMRVEIDQKRLELDVLLTTKAEKALRWGKAKFLLHGGSPSTMLARRLNWFARPPHVYKRINDSGLATSHPQEVLKIFAKFYSTLLAPSPLSPSGEDLAWMDSILIPTLSPSQLERLNSPISQLEVLNVIKALKSGSAPGPDGFSSMYYKKIAPSLSGRLVQIFNLVLQGSPLPGEMLLANMSPSRIKITHSLRIFGRFRSLTMT